MKAKSDKVLQEKLAEQLDMVSWHGHYFSCRCVSPNHDDGNPSMMVYDDYFKCLSCHFAGSLQHLDSLVNKGKIKITHIPEASSGEFLSPSWHKWKRKYGSYEDAAQAAYEIAKAMPSLLNYLKTRSIAEFTKQGKFGWIDNWISFPVMDEEGSIVDWTIRATPKKKVLYRYAVRPRLGRNEKHHLYVPDWKLLNDSPTIYVVFGIIDAWALYKAGYPSCTGISGKSIDSKLFDDIRKKIVVIPDRGEESDGVKLVHSLGWRGKLLIADYPKNCKDCSDTLTLHGVNKLKEIVT